MFYVYLIQNKDDDKGFYIGSTKDLRRRLAEHNLGKVYATRGRKWKLVYYEAYLLEKAAREREQVLKKDGRSRQALMERIKRHIMSEAI